MSKVSIHWRALGAFVVSFMLIVLIITHFTGVLSGIDAVKLVAWAGSGFACGWVLRTSWFDGEERGS